ncbi:hypothetical protein [Burkholderia phage BCSR5]|nr:hypothetical protein [Burkholderia phage BCSR5]
METVILWFHMIWDAFLFIAMGWASQGLYQENKVEGIICGIVMLFQFAFLVHDSLMLIAH